MNSGRRAAVVASLLALAAFAYSAASSGALPQGVSKYRMSRATTRPCGRLRQPPVVYQHVIWIVMENKSYSQIIGSSDAPYVNALARSCGLATNFSAESHPSLPNYIAMTSGSTQQITDDSDPSAHPLNVPSIFSQLGRGWRALAESMPSNCYLTDEGLYAVRHTPATYFTNIRGQCARQAVPLTPRPNLLARFTFITPNLCHDMHSCPSTGDDQGAQTRAGDAWLSRFVPKVLNGAAYRAGSTAVFITWDEDSPDNHIATLVLSPYTRAGTVSAKPFDHYSLLRTTEDLLGIRTHIGNAATAQSMRRPFHL